MKVFLIGAGLGTRLQPWTSLIPKGLFPVGGKPVCRHILEWIISCGFPPSEVVLRVNEDALGLFKHEFRDLPVKFSAGKMPLGTAGEVLDMKNLIDGSFIIWYMDELTKVNLEELKRFHMGRRDAVGSLALVKNIPLDVGVVKLREDRVIEFHEKPPLPFTTWSGVALLEPEILDYINDDEDFSQDVFPRLLRAEKNLYGYLSEAEWMDVGTLSHYWRACKLAEEGRL